MASHLQNAGVETIMIPDTHNGRIDLTACLSTLGEKKISSILVEGGSQIITSFIREQLFDKLITITAPKILGQGIEAIGNLGILTVDDAIKLTIIKSTRRGGDIITEATLKG
jgi:riboflavin biosynthesis pyrimidine reductase